MKHILFLSSLILICITLGFRAFDSDKNDLASQNIKGKVKKVVTYMTDNGDHSAILSKFISHYNIQGNVSEFSVYDISKVEKLSISWIYTYDTEGRKTSVSNESGEVTRYKSDGLTDSKTVYKYDSNHHKLQETRCNSKGKESWTTFKYDGKGSVIMEVDSNVMRTGSGAGIIPVHNVGLTGNTRTFIYNNFDKAGNWLENQELINGVLFRVTRREIEYY